MATWGPTVLLKTEQYIAVLISVSYSYVLQAIMRHWHKYHSSETGENHFRTEMTDFVKVKGWIYKMDTYRLSTSFSKSNPDISPTSCLYRARLLESSMIWRV